MGEEFDITVTFPDPYELNPDLAGKEAIFHIKVNSVTTVTIPELTDEFVKENLKEQTGCETAEDLKEYVKTNKQESMIMNYMWEYLQENATVKEIPQNLVRCLLRISGFLRRPAGVSAEYDKRRTDGTGKYVGRYTG